MKTMTASIAATFLAGSIAFADTLPMSPTGPTMMVGSPTTVTAPPPTILDDASGMTATTMPDAERMALQMAIMAHMTAVEAVQPLDLTEAFPPEPGSGGMVMAPPTAPNRAQQLYRLDLQIMYKSSYLDKLKSQKAMHEAKKAIELTEVAELTQLSQAAAQKGYDDLIELTEAQIAKLNANIAQREAHLTALASAIATAETELAQLKAARAALMP